MGEQEVDRYIAELFQAELLIRLNIVGLPLHGGGGLFNASDAKDGDGLLPALKSVGNPLWQLLTISDQQRAHWLPLLYFLFLQRSHPSR